MISIEPLEHRLLLAVDGPEYSSIQTFGGVGDRHVQRVVSEPTGNRYEIGTFTGTVDFNPGTSKTQLTSRGGADVFVAKYSPTLTLLWVVQLGGTGNDEAGGIDFAGGAASTTANVIAVGGFTGTTDFNPGRGTDLRTSNGKTDAFVWSLSPAGKLNWARTVGGTGYDVANGVTNDAGNTIVGGSFRETVNFRTGRTPHVFTSRGGRDGFVWRLNGESGTYGALRQIGGAGDDAVNALVRSASYYPSNNLAARTLLVAGTFAGDANFGRSSAQGADVHRTASGDAAFAVYYAPTGDLDVGTVKTYDDARPLKVADAAPNLQQDCVLLTAGDPGSRDLALWNLIGASNGTVQKFAVTGDVTTADLITDNASNLYLTATYTGTATFGSGGIAATSHGGSDVLLAKFAPTTAQPVFAASLGGTGNDRAGALALHSFDSLRLVGSFRGTVDFDPGPGTVLRTAATANDAFLLTFFAFSAPNQ